MLGSAEGLAVFSPCVAAPCAAEELRAALVGAPRLHHPPVSPAVATLGAQGVGLGGRHHLPFILPYHDYPIVYGAVVIHIDGFDLYGFCCPASRTFVKAVFPFRFEDRPTFGAELHILHSGDVPVDCGGFI